MSHALSRARFTDLDSALDVIPLILSDPVMQDMLPGDLFWDKKGAYLPFFFQARPRMCYLKARYRLPYVVL